jgi:hypothetical protein
MGRIFGIIIKGTHSKECSECRNKDKCSDIYHCDYISIDIPNFIYREYDIINKLIGKNIFKCINIIYNNIPYHEDAIFVKNNKLNRYFIRSEHYEKSSKYEDLENLLKIFVDFYLRLLYDKCTISGSGGTIHKFISTDKYIFVEF